MECDSSHVVRYENQKNCPNALEGSEVDFERAVKVPSSRWPLLNPRSLASDDFLSLKLAEVTFDMKLADPRTLHAWLSCARHATMLVVSLNLMSYMERSSGTKTSQSQGTQRSSLSEYWQ